MLAARDLPADTVVRRHATTFNDLTTALAEAELSIFHFSGHGSSDGIYLKGKSDESGELVTAERIAALLSKAQPHLKAAIFMCCFSADAIPELIRAAPYLLTVFGPADDEAAIEFVHEFYKRYFEDGSIRKACFFAEAGTRSELQIVLSPMYRSLDFWCRIPLFSASGTFGAKPLRVSG